MNLDDVPADFPRDTVLASVPGVQPKLCVRLSSDVYRSTLTDDDRCERWLVCEDLAQQLVRVAQMDAAAHPEHSREQTLERLKTAIAIKRWVSDRELDWLIRRLQTLLS